MRLIFHKAVEIFFQSDLTEKKSSIWRRPQRWSDPVPLVCASKSAAAVFQFHPSVINRFDVLQCNRYLYMYTDKFGCKFWNNGIIFSKTQYKVSVQSWHVTYFITPVSSLDTTTKDDSKKLTWREHGYTLNNYVGDFTLKYSLRTCSNKSWHTDMSAQRTRIESLGSLFLSQRQPCRIHGTTTPNNIQDGIHKWWWIRRSMHHSRPRPIHHISTYHNKATTHLQHKVMQSTNQQPPPPPPPPKTANIQNTVNGTHMDQVRPQGPPTQQHKSAPYTQHTAQPQAMFNTSQTHSTGQTYTHSTNNTSNSAKSLTNTVHTHTNSSNTNNTNTLTSFSTCGTHIHHNSKEMDGYSRMLWFQYEFRRSSI